MKTVLQALAFAFAIGSPPAGAIGQLYSSGSQYPTIRQQTVYVAAPSVALPYSFADIFNFPIEPGSQLLVDGSTGYSPQGAVAEFTNISDLPFTLYSGVDGAGAILGATSLSNGSLNDVSSTLAPGTQLPRASGVADRHQGDGYLVSVAAAPEPSGGAMLLCGLTVLAFMARRKIQPAVG